jgi:hypothetical protein
MITLSKYYGTAMQLDLQTLRLAVPQTAKDCNGISVYFTYMK